MFSYISSLKIIKIVLYKVTANMYDIDAEKWEHHENIIANGEFAVCFYF